MRPCPRGQPSLPLHRPLTPIAPRIGVAVDGKGCPRVDLRRPSAGCEFGTPLHGDGGCIGGNGGTILVADFGDGGRPDIFLPSCQRFDFLHELGNGKFVGIANPLGIADPDHRPTGKGAAAIDIDRNGSIGTAAASEALFDDGAGHFAAQRSRPGADRVTRAAPVAAGQPTAMACAAGSVAA